MTGKQSYITTIDLLRHGECEGGQVYRGSIDVPLNDTGREQMARAVGDLAPWQRIVTSPMQRCARFAEALSSRHGLPLHTEHDFREIHFGDWEGRPIDEIWRLHQNNVRRFFSDPDNATPPNGEPMAVFRERVVEGWNRLVADVRGEHVLLVAHGGTIRVLLSNVLQVPQNRMAGIEVPYASLSRIRIYQQGEHLFPSVVFHNGRLEQS